MKRVEYSKTAQKALMRIPRNWAIRITEKITAYANDPAAQANNVTALQGVDGLSRLRVGDLASDHVGSRRTRSARHQVARQCL